MPHELIVRELSAQHILSATLSPGGLQDSNNIARFFNDQPFNLNLVAVRIGSLCFNQGTAVDSNQLFSAFCVAELSRQAQIAQAEGIVANVRSRWDNFKMSVLNGGNGYGGGNVGEIVLGDFKEIILELEVQTSLFLHSEIVSSSESVASILLNEFAHNLGTTLYFRQGGRPR